MNKTRADMAPGLPAHVKRLGITKFIFSDRWQPSDRFDAYQPDHDKALWSRQAPAVPKRQVAMDLRQTTAFVPHSNRALGLEAVADVHHVCTFSGMCGKCQPGS